MRQAIVTKYIGAGERRGSRIKAVAAAGVLFMPFDDGMDVEDNHVAAAKALALKYGWKGRFIAGGMPTEDGNVYVCDTGAGDGFTIDK